MYNHNLNRLHLYSPPACTDYVAGCLKRPPGTVIWQNPSLNSLPSQYRKTPISLQQQTSPNCLHLSYNFSPPSHVLRRDPAQLPDIQSQRSLNTSTFHITHQAPSLRASHTLPPFGKPDSHFPVRRKQWE